MKDPGFYISIYAAFISTLVFGWRLYEFRAEHKKKLAITNRIITQISVFGTRILDESNVYLVTSITNIGKTKLLIERPSFLTNVKVANNNRFSYVNVRNSINFPIALDIGEKHEYKVEIVEIERLKDKGVSKIKAVIQDTFGNEHCSKWFNI